MSTVRKRKKTGVYRGDGPVAAVDVEGSPDEDEEDDAHIEEGEDGVQLGGLLHTQA